MTNLKLPELDYANLLKLADKGSEWVKIGYQTFVRRDTESSHVVCVRHFNSTIAWVSAAKTVFNNQGYQSRTTADRLDRILYPNTGWRVGITNGEMVLRNDGEMPVTAGDNIIYNA